MEQEKILGLILEKLESIDNRVGGLEAGQKSLESRMGGIEKRNACQPWKIALKQWQKMWQLLAARRIHC